LSTSTPALAAAAVRTTRADAVRNRARVLDAAREAFGEHGRDAQIEDGARRAGVGVGTVYRHFPTKDTLVEALAVDRWQEILDRMDAEALALDDPWEAFGQMFRIAGSQHENDRVFAEIACEIDGINPGPPPAVQGQLNERAQTLIDRGHAAGVLRDDVKLEDLFPIFCSLAAINRFSTGDWRRYLDMLLDGLRAR
jgi:AcrR family transcriptional regulator